ncbi:DUF6220 domain-containing protein [Paenibacillus arenilitoris]|uniref:Uncharacterized protein n=1 Tax=Paenibacillus arenilitoris TaxID=2772299 RepID=A0A927CNR8_9BACL|nr:DUF6220 domain-containing protein [Paenibacillus arenilitoris]MBD2871394.1 hypothetical protein [Paenibacillus arenilitoris]
MPDKTSVRLARIAYVAFAWLFTASIAVQVLIAGMALFVDSDSWASHASFARYFSFLPLLMALLAWIARMPKKVIWRSIGLFGMILGMFITAILSSRIGALSALHPVIALLLFWGSTVILRSSSKSVKSPASAI